MKLPTLYTVDQVAEVLQCSSSTVEKLIRAGELPRVNYSPRVVDSRQSGPRAWRIRPQALEEFIASRERRETPRVEAGAAAQAPRVVLPMATGTDGVSRLALKRPRR